MVDCKKVKTDFFNWIKTNNIKSVRKKDEKAVVYAVSLIGIPIHTIFTETDYLKIRLICSEIVLKRDSFEKEFFSDYLSIIRFLTTYAEYLTAKNKKPTRASRKSKPKSEISQGTKNKKVDHDKLKDSLTIAYYLSRVNSAALKKLGYSSWSLAFKRLGEQLEQKPSTIKNMRDEYDPYFDNGRAGWYQKSLSASRKEVFDLYSTISDSELEAIVIKILDNHNQFGVSDVETSQGERKHQKIKIKSDNMKEVKSRKS